MSDLKQAAIGIVGLFLLALGACWAWGQITDHYDGIGYARASAEWKERERSISKQAADRHAIELEKVRSEAAALRAQVDQLTESRQTERESHAKTIARLAADARAGRERLSIAVAPRTCGAVPAAAGAGDPASSGGPPQETRADLVPGAAATVFRLAGESAQLVRDYNGLLEHIGLIEAACRR